MRSLRWRLIITTATATALILGLCGIILDASIRSSLTAQFDASLLTDPEWQAAKRKLDNARAGLPQ